MDTIVRRFLTFVFDLRFLTSFSGTSKVSGSGQECLLYIGLRMQEVGRIFIFLGVALVVIGGLAMLLGRAGVPIGRLPGDIVYKGKNTTFYFPLATCILLSIVVSLVMYLIGRLRP